MKQMMFNLKNKYIMILYCIVSYFIMFGILLSQHKTFDTLTYQDVVLSVFAPFIVPIIIGMSINDKGDEK